MASFGQRSVTLKLIPIYSFIIFPILKMSISKTLPEKWRAIAAFDSPPPTARIVDFSIGGDSNQILA